MDKNTQSERQEMTDISAMEIETDPIKLRDDARRWGIELWKAVKRQTEAKNDHAMEAAARMAGVSPSLLWKLKYRPPKGVDVSVYNRLKLAHARYVKSPEATIAENLAELKALPPTPARTRLLASMEEYLRTAQGTESRTPAE
jgi:hypothetical protein